MKNKKSIFCILSLAFLVLVLNAGESFAQPTNAQLKKVLTSPKTVSVTLGSPGKIEWSSTYKKYVWSRNFTAKLKTDTPGEFLIVKGYASYDVMGGRYVFWRTFTSSNSYEGKKNPTVAEINQALQSVKSEELRYFHGNGAVVGEYESLKLAAVPDWEWHTPRSVSFYAIAVYRVINYGEGYSRAPYNPAAGFRPVDRVQEVWRLRLYREDEKSPWNGVHNGVVGSLQIPGANGVMIDRKILLERKEYRAEEAERMPRATKVPVMTQ